MKKTWVLFIFVILLMSTFMVGCWSSREIDTLAIVTALGIDKSPQGYSVTVQVLNPRALASKESTTESPVIVINQEGEDINQALRRMTTIASRKLYLSHVRVVVIGEEMAKEGISGILDYFIRNKDLRTDFYFVMVKGETAHRALDIITPLETAPGNKIAESLKEAEESWAPVNSVQIIELMNNIIAEGKEPVITAIEIIGEEFEAHTTDIMKKVHPEERIVLSYLGAYKSDKFVGYLDEVESKGYNYITNNVKRTVEEIPCENGLIGLNINKAKSKQKAYLLDNKPMIKVEIDIEMNISSVECSLDVTKEENIDKFERTAEEKLKEVCEKSIKKAQEEFKSDIFGFGKTINNSYPKIWQKMKSDWDNEFAKLPVEIQINTKIKGSGTASKPFFLKEEE